MQPPPAIPPRPGKKSAQSAESRMLTVVLRGGSSAAKDVGPQQSLAEAEESIQSGLDMLTRATNTLAENQMPIPLAVHRKEVRLNVRVSVLEKSEYFKKLINGAWEKQGNAVLSFPSIRMLDGFFIALQCFLSPAEHPVTKAPLSPGVALQVHAASCLIGVDDLTVAVEDYLISQMNESLFVRTFNACERFHRPNFKYKLFRWLLNTSLLRPYISDMKSRTASLCVSLDSKAILCQGKSLLCAQFYDAMRRELNDKSRFFSAGDCRRPAPPPYVPRPESSAEKLGKTGPTSDHTYKDVIQCYVERIRFAGDFQDETHFLLRSEATDEVLLAFGHIHGSTEFTFVNQYPSRFDKRDTDYVGSLEASFTGTTFLCHDFGISPDAPAATAFPDMVQGEHAAFIYDPNVMGRIPNAVTVIVPNLTHGLEPGPGLIERFERGQTNGLMVLRTRKPEWSEAKGSWTMDFHGRVVIASKKNFKIMNSMDERRGEWLMLFGKVTKDRFSLDYRPPLSVMQVAAIAASSFCDKLMAV